MQPLLYAAISLAAGIIAGVYGPAWLAPTGAPALSLALGIVALYWLPRPGRLRTTAFVLGLACCFSLGVGRATSALKHAGNPSPLARAMARWEPGPHDRVYLTGVLRDSPELMYDQGQPSAVRLDLEVVSASAAQKASPLESQDGTWVPAGTTAPVSGGVRLYAYPPGSYGESESGAASEPSADWAGRLLKLQAGQGLGVAVHLRPLHAYHDPGVADFTANARRQGIAATATLAQDSWRLWPAVSGGRLLRLRARIWLGLSQRLDRLAPPTSEPRLNALLRGMLLGDTSRLDDATRNAFQADGVYHLLVVAGLHIGILAAVLLFVFQMVRLPKAPAAVLTLLILGAYAWVIVGRTPTLRALLMLAVYMIARLWYRHRQMLNAVGVAALVLLVARPLDLFSASLQLTLGVAALLAGVALPLMECTSAPLRRACGQLENVGYDAAFTPRLAQWRLDLRQASVRLGWIWSPLGRRGLPLTVRIGLRLYDLMLLSLILQVGFAGFNVAYFHRLGPWAVLANALLVPAAGLLIPLAWIAVGVSTLGAGATALAGHVLSAFGGLMLWVADAMARWPGASFRVPSPPTWFLAVFATLVVIWIGLCGLWPWPESARRRWRAVAATTGLLAATIGVMAAAPFPPRLPPGLSMTVLDVGQGDSIFVSFPDGRTLLVDGGPRSAHWDTGEEIIAPFLWSLGLKRLDAILLTHAHNDHLGGLATVVSDFHPGEVWLTRSLPTEAAMRRFLAQVRQSGARIRRTASGDAYLAGPSEVQVLLPGPNYQAGPSASNNDSMVIRVSWNDESMLLEGDAEAVGEHWMLAHHVALASTVLKVGHHGSNTSSTEPFLAAVHPQVAVISVGAGNPYGHPSPAVLERLKDDHIRTFRTDLDGAVQCRLTAGKLSVYLFTRPPGIDWRGWRGFATPPA